MEAQTPWRWSAVLFDLDGTLVDTREGVQAALTAALADVVGIEPAADTIDLSLPLDEMIRSAVPAMTIDVRQDASTAFRRHYDSSTWQLANLYPGAEDCLRDLASSGVRLFVVTNKRGTAAARLLEHFHLDGYLEGLVGQPDAGQPEAKSELAGRCIAAADLDPRTTVVVGDSNQDAEMAAFWKMAFIGVTSGAGPLSHVAADEERVQLVSLADVARFVLSGSPGRDS
jgi:phosphoglycolate phosphatase